MKGKRKEDFALVYRKYINGVYRFVYSRTYDREITEEVVSDTFFALIEAIEKYNFRSKFETFLFGIAQNKLRQVWRKNSQIKTVVLDEEYHQETPQKSSNRRKLYLKTVKALEVLPKRYIEIVTLRFLQMESIKSVAKKLNLSASNVTTIQNRAITRLKTLLNEKKS
ncbi:sigma-70 family RNA polymerase sigma factor [bacterium]|nr:sigma-70 family RNA polymerase sigma factor [bacterium]